VKNPLDIMPAIFNRDHFMALISLLRDDPNIDAFIFSLTPFLDRYQEMGGRPFLDGIIEMTIEGAKELTKPFFILTGKPRSLDGAGIRQDVLERYHLAGIAAFPSLALTARVINNLYQYNRYLKWEGGHHGLET
jgi:hypothetical protein